MENLNPQAEKEMTYDKHNQKKNLWIWGCGGSILMVFMVLCLTIGPLFYTSPRMEGKYSIPTTVKNGDNFDFVITMTNPSRKTVFVTYISLYQTVAPKTLPYILEGVNIVGTEPEMNIKDSLTNAIRYIYFQDINPGETQTVTFHMQAKEVGIFSEDVQIYTDNILQGSGLYFQGIKIEITP